MESPQTVQLPLSSEFKNLVGKLTLPFSLRTVLIDLNVVSGS